MKICIGGYELNPDEDGVSHINVYSGANTALGKWLSAFTEMRLDLEHGSFNSLEAYYHWLKVVLSCQMANVNIHRFESRLNRLRILHGHSAIRYGRELRRYIEGQGIRIFGEPTEEFSRFHLAALKVKLLSNPAMLADLQSAIEDGLRIVHYYKYPTRIVYESRFDWPASQIVLAVEELRSEEQ